MSSSMSEKCDNNKNGTDKNVQPMKTSGDVERTSVDRIRHCEWPKVIFHKLKVPE